MSKTRAAASKGISPWLRRATAILMALFLIFGVQLFRFIMTPSLPRGIYLALSPRHFRAGDIVSFCPPKVLAKRLLLFRLVGPGHCAGGSVPLAKRVSAIAPSVCSRRDGLVVNGLLRPWPDISPTLSLPRLRGCGPTAAGCAFVLGDSSDSIDSRVFGCISPITLLNRLVPIVTEKKLP